MSSKNILKYMNLFKFLFQKIKVNVRTSFVKDIGMLQVGNFFSIFIGAVGSIILARLLHPAMYGMYGLVFAFVGTINIFMNWGGDYASLTLLAEAYAKKDKEEINNILIYYLKISIFAIISVGLLSVIFSPILTKLLYHNSQIGHWGRIVLIATMISTIYTILIVILQASRKIKHLVIFEIFNKFIFILLGA